MSLAGWRPRTASVDSGPRCCRKSVFHGLSTVAIPSKTKAAVGRRWETRRCQRRERSVQRDPVATSPNSNARWLVHRRGCARTRTSSPSKSRIQLRPGPRDLRCGALGGRACGYGDPRRRECHNADTGCSSRPRPHSVGVTGRRRGGPAILDRPLRHLPGPGDHADKPPAARRRREGVKLAIGRGRRGGYPPFAHRASLFCRGPAPWTKRG